MIFGESQIVKNDTSNIQSALKAKFHKKFLCTGSRTVGVSQIGHQIWSQAYPAGSMKAHVLQTTDARAKTLADTVKQTSTDSLYGWASA